MYDIEMHEPSEEFARCWQAAGRHLNARAQDGSLSWLKADLTPPFLEHLSFRLGNQLFFIRIEDVEGNVGGPGNPDGLRAIARGCRGHPCLMPMRLVGPDWKAEQPGWGLISPDTGKSVDPISLISDEKIEMTEWELHDFAVQVVRDHVQDELGCQLMSSQGNPDVDPSIWFVGQGEPEWVVVRAVRYPEKEAALPVNISDIAANCARLGKTGHFASVAVANSEDTFDQTNDVPALPLWRGHGMFVRFEGLAPITVQ